MREAVREAFDDNAWVTTWAWICWSGDSFGR